MSDSIKAIGKDRDGNPVLGSLGFFSGLVLCGVALVAQAALINAVAVKKTP